MFRLLLLFYLFTSWVAAEENFFENFFTSLNKMCTNTLQKKGYSHNSTTEVCECFEQLLLLKLENEEQTKKLFIAINQGNKKAKTWLDDNIKSSLALCTLQLINQK